MGGAMPVYALLFGEVLGILSLETEEARTQSVFYSGMFLGKIKINKIFPYHYYVYDLRTRTCPKRPYNALVPFIWERSLFLILPSSHQ